MSPVQSVELLFDGDGEAQLRDQWRQLAGAGLPSQALHTGESNAPHVTLAVRHQIPAGYGAALTQVAARLPIPVLVGGLLVFPRRGARVVLARAVVASPALLALHARAHEALRGTASVDERLAPGRWQPHVTLSRSLPADRLGEAVALLMAGQPAGGELETSAAALRRWDGVARRAWTLG